MQINRLFEIVYMLLDNKLMIAKDLAAHFEVSVRTIYRDIDILSSSGIPIYTSQGKGGGISLLEDYVLDKSVLSEGEQNEILFALQSLAITKYPETNGVLSKLSSLFNKNKTNWIEVDLSPWGSSKDQKCDFIMLKDAILNRQIIQFDYFSGSGEKGERRVEPIKLVFKMNAWYLRGYCLSRNAYRTFKISRMSQVQTTHGHFATRAESVEDAPEQRSQQWITVELKVSPEGAYRVYDEFSETAVTKYKDGSFRVVTLLPDNKWLIGYLLSFGTDIDIVAPQHIRDRVQEQAEKILGNYRK